MDEHTDDDAFGNAGGEPDVGGAGYGGVEENPPTYLWQSIAVTLLCCLPLGIPAIVYATRAQSELSAGNIQGARQASENAKLWCWSAAVSGVIGGVILGVLQAGGA